MTQKRKRGSRRVLVVGVGMVISLIFLALAFRELHPAAFIDALQQVNPGWLIAAAALYFVAVVIIALRWQFLLRAVQFIPLIPVTGIVAIGYMGNNVYPLRAGEALRIYLLKRNHDVPVIRSTTVVIVERVFDGLVMLTFIVVSLLLIDVQSDAVQSVATVAAAIFIPAITVFFLLAAQPNLLRRITQWVIKLLPGKLGDIVAGLSEDIIHGLESLRSPINLLGAIITSYLTWAVEAFVYWMVMWAFGLELGYPVALLVVGTVNLAGLIPASPGQVGVYEFFVSTVLIAVGIAQNTALAYAIVVHIVIWLPVTVVGFILLVRQGMGWTDIQKAPELEANASTG